MKKMVKKKMGGKVKKYEDGGPGPVTRKDIKQAKMQAKLSRINAGTEPSTYEKVANISGNVAKTAASAAQVANAVRDTRTGTSGPGGMKKGGSVRKYQDGGMTGFERRQAKKVGRAETKATVAKIEGEGTVAQKRDNRAKRVSTMAGTGRAKTPKSLSTSISTTDNRNSGNTTNTTNSGSSSGAMGGSGGRSGSSSGVDNSRKSSTSVNQSQDNSRTNNVKNTSNTNVRQSQNNSKNTTVNQSQNNSRNSSKSTTNYTDKSNTTKVDQSRKNTQIGKGNTSTKNSNYKKGGAIKIMKTGGMVNSNAKVSASKVARGKVGGTSTAPKTAVPRAKYGMSMRKK